MNRNIFLDLLQALDDGEKSAVLTVVKDQQESNQQLEKVLVRAGENMSAVLERYSCDTLLPTIETALNTGYVKHDEQNLRYFVEPYYPEPQLIVLGGGHIAKPLVELGKKVGFATTVVDDRLFFANRERFPDADTVICDSFERCFEKLNLNKSAYVVIVTRGHRHDLVCLKETLKHTTAYTGMIGSSRRIISVMEMLMDEGYDPERLAKVCAPIGIDIGAVTPDEIAISIIAEVIEHRRKNNLYQMKDQRVKTHWPEYDHDVLRELSKNDQQPKAIVTILSSKGSVPRKAGAKMIVWPDGRIIGSIGGGCSEADVITTAYEVIRTGKHVIQTVDMTGEVAENEGMVCGGIMEVMIEPWQI